MSPHFKFFTAITLFFCILAMVGTIEYHQDVDFQDNLGHNDSNRTEKEEDKKYEQSPNPNVVPAPTYIYINNEDK